MMIKRILILLLVIFLLPISVSAAEADENDLIRQIILYYGRNQRAAETDLCRLFDQLEEVNPEAAEDWHYIIEAWDQISSDAAPIGEVLPDGLPQDDSLCIIVMGYQLASGGGMKQELYQRLEVTLASAQKYPNAYILCTGGGTASGSHATEAGQMIWWLEKQGIPPERLIRENKSVSTEQNALFSLDLLQESCPQVKSLALISSDYHLRRCRLLFDAVIHLQNLESQYSIVGFAGAKASHKGFDEGFGKETKNLGTLMAMSLEHVPSPPVSLLTGLELTGITEYTRGDAPALRVLAQYDTGFVRDVTDRAEISGFSPDISGAQKIKAQYTENDITLETQIEIRILPLPATLPPTHPPTEDPETEPVPEQTLPIPAQEEPPLPASYWILPGIAISLILYCLLRSRPRGKYTKRKH